MDLGNLDMLHASGNHDELAGNNYMAIQNGYDHLSNLQLILMNLHLGSGTK
jgi:hypothetical protein